MNELITNYEDKIADLELEIVRHHNDFERIQKVLDQFELTGTVPGDFDLNPVGKGDCDRLIRAIRNIVG